MTNKNNRATEEEIMALTREQMADAFIWMNAYLLEFRRTGRRITGAVYDEVLLRAMAYAVART